jgi:hypothetical protein
VPANHYLPIHVIDLALGVASASLSFVSFSRAVLPQLLLYISHTKKMLLVALTSAVQKVAQHYTSQRELHKNYKKRSSMKYILNIATNRQIRSDFNRIMN